jgi:hypothetical protein
MSYVTLPQTASSIGAVVELAGNTGTATPVSGVINVVGTGGNVTTTGSGNTLTIAVTATGPTWFEVTGTSATMVAGDGYIANNAGMVTLTLPTVAAQGTFIYISGKGAGLFKIAQNAGQSIGFTSIVTTTGVTGSLTINERYDTVTLCCITANTMWTVFGPAGNYTYV